MISIWKTIFLSLMRFTTVILGWYLCRNADEGITSMGKSAEGDKAPLHPSFFSPNTKLKSLQLSKRTKKAKANMATFSGVSKGMV